MPDFRCAEACFAMLPLPLAMILLFERLHYYVLIIFALRHTDATIICHMIQRRDAACCHGYPLPLIRYAADDDTLFARYAATTTMLLRRRERYALAMLPALPRYAPPLLSLRCAADVAAASLFAVIACCLMLTLRLQMPLLRDAYAMPHPLLMLPYCCQ